MASCRICGATPQNCTGWLERQNEKGVEGVWECRPACGVQLSEDDKVLGAIDSGDA
jgi:hypothetical protein